VQLSFGYVTWSDKVILSSGHGRHCFTVDFWSSGLFWRNTFRGDAVNSTVPLRPLCGGTQPPNNPGVTADMVIIVIRSAVTHSGHVMTSRLPEFPMEFFSINGIWQYRLFAHAQPAELISAAVVSVCRGFGQPDPRQLRRISRSRLIPEHTRSISKPTNVCLFSRRATDYAVVRLQFAVVLLFSRSFIHQQPVDNINWKKKYTLLKVKYGQ